MRIALILLLANAVSLAIGSWCYKCVIKPMPEALDVASMRLLRKVYESSDNKNVVLSPLGLFTLLSLYTFGAEGQVADEIVDFLGAVNKKHLTDSYRKLSRKLSGMDPDLLAFSGNVYIDNQYTLNNSFILNTYSYESEVNNIDFRDPKSAAKIINEWVSTKTKGKIDKIMSEDDVTSDLVVALYNVIFFKGHWAVPFNERDTKENCFLTDNFQLIKKPMMHLLRSLDYYEDEGAGVRMIQLPYKESKFKMVMVLPSHLDGLSMVLRQISETGLLHYVNRMNQSEIEIDLYLPRFEIKSEHDLRDILPKIGISSIFNKGAHGVVNEAPVSVDKVFQQAFIEVDEKGSTAGAVTGMHAVPISLPRTISFKVDRPFLFAILYDDIVLVAGTLSH